MHVQSVIAQAQEAARNKSGTISAADSRKNHQYVRRSQGARYRDFSELPDDALRSLAHDLANPKEAMRRIRAARRGRKA